MTSWRSTRGREHLITDERRDGKRKAACGAWVVLEEGATFRCSKCLAAERRMNRQPSLTESLADLCDRYERALRDVAEFSDDPRSRVIARDTLGERLRETLK